MRVRVPLGEAGGSSPSTLFPPPSRPDLAAPGPGRLSFPHLATETRLGEIRNLSERCGYTKKKMLLKTCWSKDDDPFCRLFQRGK
ncbi:hypothetical protein CapIbe_007574 [Capra ibex]